MSNNKPPDKGPAKESRDDSADAAGQPGFAVNDPRELVRNMFRVMEEGGKVFAGLAERSNGKNGPYSTLSEMGEASKVLGTVARHWASDPTKFVEAQGKLARSYADLWGRSVKRFLGEEVEPAAKPEPGDARFKDPDWSETQFFDFWKQAYLLTARWADEMVANADSLDEKTKKTRRVLPNPAGERAVAFKLSSHQPGGTARDAKQQCGKSRHRHAEPQ